MNDIPNGTYGIKWYGGTAWSFSKILDRRNKSTDIDDVMGGFLKDSELKREDVRLKLNNGSYFTFKFDVLDGNVKSEDITLDEFLND